jgi:fructose-1,6-bisphosphatase II
MGIGGTPEGVITACAARALGGGMQGRLAPQSDAEASALVRAGFEVDRQLALDELVSTDRCLFVATGVTRGSLLRGAREEPSGVFTESLVLAGATVRHVERSVRWPLPGASAGMWAEA